MKVEVKICGITSVADAETALAAGADYLGVIFHEKSPRYVEPVRAARIIRSLRGTKFVGVFVNASRADVERIVGECGLYAAQIHGDEPAGEFENMGVPVWRAVKFDGKQWQPSPEDWPAARYVVDAAVKGRYGGTGAVADWAQAARLAQQRPVMLAGGLTPENVAEAIRRVRPLGVDTASGVQSSPGRKDPARVKAFLESVRSAERKTKV